MATPRKRSSPRRAGTQTGAENQKQRVFQIPPKSSPVKAFDRLTSANCFDCTRKCRHAGGWLLACVAWFPAVSVGQVRP